MKGMLSCKTLMDIVHKTFSEIKENNQNIKISLADNLMAGFALFSLKYPSLLQFDKHYSEELVSRNLKNIYRIQQAPSDTQMRTRLDAVEPNKLRRLFKRLLSQFQRSKYLELFQYYNNRYLLPLDGTGYFYSKDLHCENCCEKNHRDGSKSYYHQMLSGAIVHPEQKIVLPFAPEPIMKSDGTSKNDCELNAAKRFLADLKREHPHLKVIITGDGLFSNGPFIKALKKDNHDFILVAKEKDHKALFEEFKALPSYTHQFEQGGIKHRFSWQNELPINDTHSDCTVNILEYWEENEKKKTQHWVWVTNLHLTEKTVPIVMKGGRARHKIENETFNTIKNQGYHFEHNFGHGYKNLSTVFSYLMMAAFFVDQLQQLGCKTFKKALNRLHTKKSLWERKRSLFFNFIIDSIEDLWGALAYGHKQNALIPDTS